MNKNWYINKGYSFTNIGDKFFVRADDLTKGSKVKVKVKCDYCNKIVDVVWKDYVKYKYDKYSCSKCKQKKMSEYTLTKRQTELYERARDFCMDMDYILLTPKNKILNSKTIVKCKCRKHGVFDIKIYALILKHGCKKCQYENNSNVLKLTPDEVENRISKVGGKLLNKDEYIGWYQTNLSFKCQSCGSLFNTSLYSFTRNNGMLCPT